MQKLEPPLGETQTIILRMVASASDKELVVNQIASKLGQDQAGIFRSVKSLMQKKLLFGDQEGARTRRYLSLTDKGGCYAVLFCGVDPEVLSKNYDFLEVVKMVNEFRDIVRKPDILSDVTNDLFTLLVKYNIFDNEGFVKEEIESPLDIRPNHFLIAIKVELINNLISEGPGDDFENYNKAGMMNYLAELQQQSNKIFAKIRDEAANLSSDEKESMEEMLDENNKNYVWPEDPNDEEELK